MSVSCARNASKKNKAVIPVRVTALEYPVLVPSSEPRDSGKDGNSNNEYDYYDDRQKGAFMGVVHVLCTRGAHFLIDPPIYQSRQRGGQQKVSLSRLVR